VTHGQAPGVLASVPLLICEKGRTIMNLIMPDLGKVLWFIGGTFLGGKLLSKLRG
jgi:hypothetical protein